MPIIDITTGIRSPVEMLFKFSIGSEVDFLFWHLFVNYFQKTVLPNTRIVLLYKMFENNSYVRFYSPLPRYEAIEKFY